MGNDPKAQPCGMAPEYARLFNAEPWLEPRCAAETVRALFKLDEAIVRANLPELEHHRTTVALALIFVSRYIACRAECPDEAKN